MTLTAIRYVPNFLPDILLTEKESDVIQKKKKKNRSDISNVD